MSYWIRKIHEEDISSLENIVKQNWGSSVIVSKRKKHNVNQLMGFVVEEKNEIYSYGLYEIQKRNCELIILESLKQRKGYGTIILNRIIETAKKEGCKAVSLVTTNDNIDALKYYQERKFKIKNIRINEIDKSRKIKPEIPLVGYFGIEIRDEIELEFEL